MTGGDMRLTEAFPLWCKGAVRGLKCGDRKWDRMEQDPQEDRKRSLTNVQNVRGYKIKQDCRDRAHFLHRERKTMRASS